MTNSIKALPTIQKLRLFVLAAWFGLSVYFSAVVAPSVFITLRSFELANANEIAGTIVNRSLAFVNISGFCLSLLLLISIFAIPRLSGGQKILQMILFVIIGACTGAGEWIIAARMRGLRAAMGGHIDQVPLTDPNHAAFSILHGYSVAALSIAMIAAFVAALSIVFSRDAGQNDAR